MEGRKFSSSRSVVIYVRDFLDRYDADALRYYLSAAGPENQDTDFTWSEFVRRNNDELVAGWGNLVNRTVSMTAKNLGVIPEPGEKNDADRALLATSAAGFDQVGAQLERARFKAGLAEAMNVVAEANRYLSDQAPWQLKNTRPAADGHRAAHRAAGRRRRQDAADAVPALVVHPGARRARQRGAVGAHARTGRGGRADRGRHAVVRGAHRRLLGHTAVALGADPVGSPAGGADARCSPSCCPRWSTRSWPASRRASPEPARPAPREQAGTRHLAAARARAAAGRDLRRALPPGRDGPPDGPRARRGVRGRGDGRRPAPSASPG